MRGTADTVGIVSQLTGLNALELISMIVKAADSARMHKTKCDKFAQWLTLVESTVRPLLKDPALMEIGGVPETLEQLKDALGRACILVDGCKDISCLYLLTMGCIFATQLEQLKAEIEDMLDLLKMAAIPRHNPAIPNQNAITCTTKVIIFSGPFRLFYFACHGINLIIYLVLLLDFVIAEI